MSIKMQVDIMKLTEEKKVMAERLDNLEKSVNILKRSVSHIERHGTSDGGVVVPQTALPEALDKLEIGRNPQGT
jgi:hypothetical protein